MLEDLATQRAGWETVFVLVGSPVLYGGGGLLGRPSGCSSNVKYMQMPTLKKIVIINIWKYIKSCSSNAICMEIPTFEKLYIYIYIYIWEYMHY